MFIPPPYPNDEIFNYEDPYHEDTDADRNNNFYRRFIVTMTAGSLAMISTFGLIAKASERQKMPVLPEYTCDGTNFLRLGSDLYPQQVIPVAEFVKSLQINGDLEEAASNIIATNPTVIWFDGQDYLITPNGNAISYPSTCGGL